MVDNGRSAGYRHLPGYVLWRSGAGSMGAYANASAGSLLFFGGGVVRQSAAN